MFRLGNFSEIIESSTGVSEEKVKELIKENNTSLMGDVDNKITQALESYRESGAFDDTKVYNTYDDMITKEPVGRTDTLYILRTNEEGRGIQYIWNGTSYEVFLDTITPKEITEIVG